MNDQPQKLHAYGFSPEWIFRCRRNASMRDNTRPHSRHCSDLDVDVPPPVAGRTDGARLFERDSTGEELPTPLPLLSSAPIAADEPPMPWLPLACSGDRGVSWMSPSSASVGGSLDDP